jgi:hypothetical protein
MNCSAPEDGHKFKQCTKCKLPYMHCDVCGYVRIAHLTEPAPVIKQLRLPV